MNTVHPGGTRLSLQDKWEVSPRPKGPGGNLPLDFTGPLPQLVLTRAEAAKRLSNLTMSGRIIEAQDSDVSQELESQSAASTVSRRYVLPSGRIMPNTIFVGGIDFEMGEDEMRGFFTRYGAVKQVKIISDGGGVSRGYGFVSFHNDVDIQKIISESQINFKGKKLKIGPAIRKQQDSYPIHLVQARPAPLITSPTPCVCQNTDTYFQSPGFPGSALQYVQTYSYPSPPAVALPQVQMGYPHPAYNYQAATQWPPGGQWRWMMPQPTTGTYVNSPYPEMINPGTVFVQRECDAQQTPSSPLDSVEKEKRVHRFTV
ncbi:deleted in azoospermia-like [Scyliorhinus torazame]|uniref:deleted in azoospermia-like n=1 Tax=Scyliorhinus torazame TaxID=75743 RepID=UPI003B58FFF0